MSQIEDTENALLALLGDCQLPPESVSIPRRTHGPGTMSANCYRARQP